MIPFAYCHSYIFPDLQNVQNPNLRVNYNVSYVLWVILFWQFNLTICNRYLLVGSLRMKETMRLHFHFSLSFIGEGNGNSTQCSCLENPRTGEPGGLPPMGSHRVGHNWSDLAAAGTLTTQILIVKTQDKRYGVWMNLVTWNQAINGPWRVTVLHVVKTRIEVRGRNKLRER